MLRNEVYILAGWRVIYANSQTIDNGKAIQEIETALSNGGIVKGE